MDEPQDTMPPPAEDPISAAQKLLQTITGYCETAKRAAAETGESQKLAATAVLDVQGNSEVVKKAAAEAADAQRLAAAALADAQGKATEVSGTATLALAAKTQITDEQAVIATKSDHIQKAQEHADKVRADLDRALTAGNGCGGPEVTCRNSSEDRRGFGD